MVEVLATDEFRDWYQALSEHEADQVTVGVERLEQLGLQLPFPHSSAINGSKYAMRELRIAQGSSPIRVFYVFDPRRNAVLVIGGDKSNDKRFYERMIAIADRIYEEYLEGT